MKKEKQNFILSAIRIFFFSFMLLSLSLSTYYVFAEVSLPQEDQTQDAPLASPPTSVDPRYLSGIGVDNNYTIFYEDRNDTAGCSYGARIYFVHTINGAFNFSSPVATNICDTHFVVKDWQTTIGATTYAYRAWGSRANNQDHNFYVSNDLVNWIRNPIVPNTSFTFNDPNGTGLHVYYGFHDVVQLNGNYMGFAETNGSRTLLVWSDEGLNDWDIIDIVGGAGVGPLDLDVGSTGPTPTGNFVLMEVNGEEVYGKLGVPGDDSGAYLAINSAAAQASSPADAESAFLDPNNWTWSDGNTGFPGVDNRVLSAISQHDIREVWTVPLSNSLSDHVIIYTARYGNSGSDFGCAAATADCTVVLPASPASNALPDTGFERGIITKLPQQPLSKEYLSTDIMLEIPSLNLSMAIVGVPQSEKSWDVTWLGNNAGYLAGSAFPTWSGNTVLTAHVWDAFNQPGPFVKLKTLKYGDQVQIHAWGLVYVYEVRESKLVTIKNVDLVLKPEEYDWLTLVTCEFYNPFTGDYLFRRAVRAVLVDVRDG